jgi:DNA-binding NtrC family response regulator
LERSVREGLFREDLYHRLNVVAIKLPPLRERREDIPNLADYLLRKHATATGKVVTSITDEARERLAAYSWPGNVRELANVIERAVVLSSGPSITLRYLPSRIAGGEASGLFENLSYRDGMNAARKLLILKALSRTQGNRAAAAKLLGLESKYLLKLMKSLEIE